MGKYLDMLLIFLMVASTILILLVGIFLIKFYFSKQMEECTQEPLVYGIREFEETYGVEAFGSVTFKNHPEIHIYFDRNDVDIEVEEWSYPSSEIYWNSLNLTDILNSS